MKSTRGSGFEGIGVLHAAKLGYQGRLRNTPDVELLIFLLAPPRHFPVAGSLGEL